MSKQQQPKEYIITEEELDHFVTCSSKNDCVDCKYSAPEFQCTPRIMANKIRSRPHPAPQAPDFSHISEDRHGCLTCLNPGCPIWQAADQNCWKSQKEHDAAIARKAREDVLDKIQAKCTEEINHFVCDLGNSERMGSTKTAYRIRDYAESLRRQQGGREQGGGSG